MTSMATSRHPHSDAALDRSFQRDTVAASGRPASRGSVERSALAACGLAFATAVAALGCTVEDAFLDRQLFLCNSPDDCGAAWGCMEPTPYSAGYCAPRCDANDCDGICTGDTHPLCQNTCYIADDGTPSRCQSEDFACVRTSYERNEGICAPQVTCEVDEDCGAEEVCLTRILRELSGDEPDPNLNNLYCVPKPDAEGVCPSGSLVTPLAVPDSPVFCQADCSVADPGCPPGFGCLTQLQRIAPITRLPDPICELGNYGLSCQDDTNCFVGQCRDTGSAQGKVCTISCNQASRIAGGCDNLIYPLTLEGVLYRMECDTNAVSPDNSGLCVVRYNINFPCTRDPGSAYECSRDLSCERIDFVTGGGLDMCTKACTSNATCNERLGSDPSRWLYVCATALVEGQGLIDICMLPSDGS